ncbi:MAG: UDP-2,3-diacylglucosamine diphosphatase [Halioglobus sp.]|nr:UDP-2,3-diacylglucosamine diphosphatase [Halioglobus sp.]
MACTYFISDLHLTSAQPAVTRAFARFLQDHQHADALYILGDLFETWIGDNTDPLGIEVSALLKQFTRAGPGIFLMHGNRDFLLAQEFAAAAGATLLPDPTVIDLYGRPTLLTHGDALCTADVEYQALRDVVRKARWQAEFLARPAAERRQAALAARNMSREAVANKQEDIVDVAPEAVAGLLRSHGVNQLIHGHTHRPAHHHEPGGERWVLGDWSSESRYLEATPTDNKLINYLIY